MLKRHLISTILLVCSVSANADLTQQTNSPRHDDMEAECERLKGLGAKKVARIRTWIVMEAPTGHRFCLVRPQGDDWPGEAKEFNEVGPG